MVRRAKFVALAALLMIGIVAGLPLNAWAQKWSSGNDLPIKLLSDDLIKSFNNLKLLNRKTRVAIWPFQEKDTPITTDIAETFNTALLSRLIRDTEGTLLFVGRKELRTLIADLDESSPAIANPVALVSSKANVDVLIIGTLSLEKGRAELSYKAVGASGRRLGRILAATGARSVTFNRQQAVMTLDQAVRAAVRKLARMANDLNELTLAGIRFETSRVQTPLGRYIEQRASDEFTDVFSNILSNRMIRIGRQQVTPDDLKPSSAKDKSRLVDKGRYALSGTYWDFGSSIDLRLRLTAPDGRVGVWNNRILPPQGIQIRPSGNFPSVLLENDGLGPFRFSLTSGRGENPVYDIGDKLNFMVRLEHDAWLYCFYRQADGKMLKIIPNRYHENAFIKGGQVHTIPGRRLPFDLNIGEPAGVELIKCFAVSRDVSNDLPYELRSMEFPVLPDGMDFRLPAIFRRLQGVVISESSVVITVKK
jgi:hypothetical protein